MSDDTDPSPIPWGLVEHVKRTESGRTTLQISLSIETRARLAQAALDLGCSKLALIRAAISQFLLAHEENRRSGQERAFLATSEVIPPPLTAPVAFTGASGPVPGGTPPEPDRGTVEAPEPPDSEAIPAPPRKPSRRKKS